MAYTTILFDADGTLLDFERSEREAIKEALSLHKIQVDDEQIATYSAINDGLWKKLERGEIERSVLLYHRFELFCEHYGYVADAKAIARDYMNALSHKGYMLQGARELISSLYGRVRMYIVTNGVKFIQDGRLAITGIAKYFDGIFISEEVGATKPDVAFFSEVERRIDGFCKRDALIVGDSLSSDIKGGVNFGIDTCWYAPDKSCESDLPTYTVRSFEELRSLILDGGDGLEQG